MYFSKLISPRSERACWQAVDLSIIFNVIRCYREKVKLLVVKFCVFVEVFYMGDGGVVVFEEEGEELFALRGEGEGAGGGVRGGGFIDEALGAEIGNDV